jgi:hypothetical protein
LLEHWNTGGSEILNVPDYQAVRTSVEYATLPNELFVNYQSTGGQELYDYTVDPWAMTNLAVNPSAGNQKRITKMLKDLKALAACAGSACHDAEWQP